MKTIYVTFSFQQDMLGKLKEKARREGYPNVQEMFYELARRLLYTKPKTGRKHKESADMDFMLKFATPTKQTPKILNELSKQGLI